MFKIGLPNPYETSVPMFLSQMRIALKAFEKAYEDATKELTEEEKEGYWFAYRHPRLIEAFEEDKTQIDVDVYDEVSNDIELHFGN